MVEDVSTDDAIKVAVYEWEIPHLMLDKSDASNRAGFQPIVKSLEGRFRNVKSNHPKSLFAKKYGMTAGAAA